jgi:hypothetical protein
MLDVKGLRERKGSILSNCTLVAVLDGVENDYEKLREGWFMLLVDVEVWEVEVNGERKASMLCWFQSLRQPQQRQFQRLNHFSSKFSLSFGLFQKDDFQAPKCSGSFRKSLFLFSKKKKANEPKIVQKCPVAESRPGLGAVQ